MTQKINEIKDYLSKTSEKEIEYLLSLVKNIKHKNRDGLNTSEFKYFNKVKQLFNKFHKKYPISKRHRKLLI